MITAFFVFT